MWDWRSSCKLNLQSFQMSLNAQEIYFKLKAVMKCLFTNTVRCLDTSRVLIVSERWGHKLWNRLWSFLQRIVIRYYMMVTSKQLSLFCQTYLASLPLILYVWNVWTTATFSYWRCYLKRFFKKIEIISIM